MNELYSAILDPSGPNYATWFGIFGGNQVPLKSPHEVKAELGDKSVPVYLLDLPALSLPQRARLLSVVAQKFGVPIYEVEAQLKEKGFPIRAADVIVSISTRAFV